MTLYKPALAAAALALTALSAPAQAQNVEETVTVSLEGATRMANACEALAKQQGWKVTVWITDTANTPVYVKRMQGAHVRTIDFAKWKAETALTFEGSTDPNNRNAMVSQVFNGRKEGPAILARAGAMLSGGGLRIMSGDKVAGAIGVGGANGRDEECAQAGLNALGR